MHNVQNVLRKRRENQALLCLKIKNIASAIELGKAAIEGEHRACKIPISGQESIGLSIGLELVRRNLASVTRNNQFRAVKGSGRAPQIAGTSVIKGRSKPMQISKN